MESKENRLEWFLNGRLICAFLAVLIQAVSADVKSDLLALTANAQVRSVWLVWPWADSSYAPIQSRQDACAEGCALTQVRVSDTDDGQYRWIDSTVQLHNHPLLTEKDASQVIYEVGPANPNNCYAGSAVMIRDFKCTQPARRLFKCGPQSKFEGVLACSWNPVTDSEYVYAMGTGSTAAYRVALIKPGYTADSAHAYKLPTNGEIDWALNGSADNLYFAAELPWPNTMFVNSITGQQHPRHVGSDGFGCNANIAHDNSYRFFYLEDSHTKFRMYGPYANRDSSEWDVDVVSALPLKPLLSGQDNGYPRWTNNPRFFTCTPPVEAGQLKSGDMSRFGWSASQVKSTSANNGRHMVLGKFSADFKTVEGMALIAGGDIRMESIYGRAWVALGPITAGKRDMPLSRAAARASIMLQGDLARATFSGPGVVTIVNASGRTVAQAFGNGTAACALASKPAGTYLVKVTTGSGVYSARVLIDR